MLDVSPLSNYPAECERLLMKETLTITDIMTMVDGQWVTYKPYIEAFLYFEKITTGNALDETWNISQSKKVQETLSVIISDYIAALLGTKHGEIPEYIRSLFRHYCLKNDTPLFNGIHLIQEKTTVKLQRHIFIEIIKPKKGKDHATEIALEEFVFVDEEQEDEKSAEVVNDGKQRISHEKVHLLFPNAVMYLNDQNQEVFIDENVHNTNGNGAVERVDML